MTARVLIVDDAQPNRALLKAWLEAEYYEVYEAADGAEALKAVSDFPPDIVLMDVLMPGLDGLEACRLLKSMPSSAHIPVVLVTALDRAEDRIKGFEAGADDFLTKPVDPLELFARIRGLVRSKIQMDEWLVHQSAGERLGVIEQLEHDPLDVSIGSARLLLIEDDEDTARLLQTALEGRCTLDRQGEAREGLISAHGGLTTSLSSVSI